jgi:hypothetical protein
MWNMNKIYEKRIEINYPVIRISDQDPSSKTWPILAGEEYANPGFVQSEDTLLAAFQNNQLNPEVVFKIIVKNKNINEFYDLSKYKKIVDADILVQSKILDIGDIEDFETFTVSLPSIKNKITVFYHLTINQVLVIVKSF